VVVALEVAVGALAVAAGDYQLEKDQVVLVVAVVVAGYSPGQAVVEALELLLMAQVGEAVLLLATIVVVGQVMVAVAGEQTVVVVFHLVLAVKQLH
jgi:predicted metal-binding protein